MGRNSTFVKMDLEDNHDPEDADYEYGDEADPDESLITAREEVRRVLGAEAHKFTTKQIEEACWECYYDVDEAIAYLRTTFRAPPPPPKPQKKQTLTEGKCIRGSYSHSSENNHLLFPYHIEQRAFCKRLGQLVGKGISSLF
jgi:HBS1 N-terminus